MKYSNEFIAETAVIYQNCEIAKNVRIGNYTVIGKPPRPRYNESKKRIENSIKVKEPTLIGEGCFIDTHVIIEASVSLEANCIVESKAVIERGTIIKESTLIVHASHIGGFSKIAENCIIGGFLAERSVIGANCRIFGMLLHKHQNAVTPWDDTIEDSPVLDERVVVGMGAKIVGGVKIGNNVYVGVNSIVTKSIPPFHVVVGVNKIIPFEDWPGDLSNSDFWNEG